jgi:transglutaminase-like putative cysteine protease
VWVNVSGSRWASAAHLVALCRADAQQTIPACLRGFIASILPLSDRDRAVQIQRFVAALPYVRESHETYRSPRLTAVAGGDCDDHARLVRALAGWVGLPARLVFLASSGGVLVHVWTQIFVDGKWRHCETIVQAELGEHPLNARARDTRGGAEISRAFGV